MVKKIFLGLVAVLVLAVAGLAVYLSQANSYQSDGVVELAVLDKPVRVVRDSAGIPYVYAESIDDLLRAQGYVTAQDRLFQIEFTRHLVTGRLAELLGSAVLASDRKIRVLGIPRYGREHAALLGEKSRRNFELYLEGLNAYIQEQRDEHPLGLTLLGVEAQPWTLEESVALRYFLSWASTPNMEAELLSLALIDRFGREKAAEISQLTVNPDGELAVSAGDGYSAVRGDIPSSSGAWASNLSRALELGSNQWVMSGSRSLSGAPMLANNPHIDTRNLPGTWHPIGLIAPGFRAIGVSGPGTVGLAIARTDRVAYGVTNSNGDGIDLFIEQIDPLNPDNYLDSGRSVPFRVTEELMRVRNRETGGFDEVPLRIRYTRRGPVISDHELTADDGRVISLRWAAPEDMGRDMGELGPLLAQSVEEAGEVIGRMNAPYNYVVADVNGSIGHFTAGKVPIRRFGNGSLPLPASVARDNWAGLIPWQQMPGVINPERAWVGNANNRTLPAGYPYAYSTYFAHSWRYRRMLELLDNDSKLSAEDHWEYMYDIGNTLASRVVPVMLDSMAGNEELADIVAVLQQWDYVDDPDEVAPMLFQAIWRQFALRVFSDELGAELTPDFLGLNYYWEDRLWSFIEAGESIWFDDQNTVDTETMADLFVQAAAAARAELTEQLGPDMSGWQWGKLHTVTFFSPIAPGDMAADLLGGGTFAKEGSGESLNRGKYKFNEPYRATFIDSMRFAVDMADRDKVMAVLSGGASGRQFDPHLKDQMEIWRTGEPNYWWFSDTAIAADAQSELLLTPAAQ